MEQLGTMKNGVIVPDEPEAFQEGERVVLEPTEADWPADVEYPFHETREEIIQSIRDAMAEIEAGDQGISIDELRTLLKREYGPPYCDED